MLRRPYVMRLAILLLAALPATATVVTLERDGVPVAGEVCRFRAGDRENPFGRWLASQELTCVAAGAALELPAGQWNVFGRVEGNAVTEPVIIDSAASPPSLELEVIPAAIVQVTLPEGRSGVVYAPRRAIAYPVTSRTTVPAGEELWLLVVERSTPVAVFPIAALEAATERTIDARGGGIASLLAWLQLPDEDRVAASKAPGVAAPQVRATATAGGPARDSDPLPPLPLLHGAFVLIRGLEAGEVQLDVGGRGWLPSRRAVRVGASNLTIAGTPLVVRGASTIIVHWSASRDVPGLDQSIGSCHRDAYQSPQYLVTLSSCGDGCTAVRQEVFAPELELGSFSADGLVPGKYQVELKFGSCRLSARTPAPRHCSRPRNASTSGTRRCTAASRTVVSR